MIVIDPTDPTAGKLRDTHFCRWADGQMGGCLRWGALMVSVVHETRPSPRISSVPLQVGRDEEGAPTGGGPPLAAQSGDDDGPYLHHGRLCGNDCGRHLFRPLRTIKITTAS